jgi:molybdenum cofactor cytidylyltransferase
MMQLEQALRVCNHDVIAFVGAGGKTTAMFRLANELVAQGKRVVVTTTTRLSAAQTVKADSRPPLRYTRSHNFSERARAALATQPKILIVGEDVADDKVGGVPPAFIDELAALNVADAVLYEADGARMLPFKAPAAHEPVVANSTTLLVPVVGITALGAPLDDAHVHRAEIVARLAGARLGDIVTPTLAARVIAHPAGGLKAKPRGARVVTLVNQVEEEMQLDAARQLARLLLGYKQISAVAIGAVQHANPIRETHRRVAAIVLAAGEGARMQGRVKQLLPWRGKTLIENAIDVAAASRAVETLVVLGANAARVRAVIRGAPARVVLNRDWKTGHASSIRVALNALSRETDAAIFVNADQPRLSASVIDQIIQQYYDTGAHIVVPVYAGKRGSPVLFDRVHFDELMGLQGEQGGRELLSKYREQIEFVEFADARLALDVDTPAEYESIVGEN